MNQEISNDRKYRNYSSIYKGIKVFFKPYAKVNIDIIAHHNIKPCKCIEVIAYFAMYRIESRSYLAYNELLNRLNKTEFELKLKKFISELENKGKDYDLKAATELVQQNMIAHYILNHLQCVISEEDFTVHIIRKQGEAAVSRECANNVK